MTAKADCPLCEGVGFLRACDPDGHPPKFKRCECILREDLLANAERVMPGLSLAPPVARSRLADLWKANVILHAPERWFRAHLRHVAIRRPPIWSGRVISDADLITSWLASVALKGGTILDPDSYGVSTQFLTLADLVIPPDLLIIRMGVKAARNVAASEVLCEALMLRIHDSKPTWVWAVPDLPLGPGHLFWSDELGRVLATFKPVGGMTGSGNSGSTSPSYSSPSYSSRPTEGSPNPGDQMHLDKLDDLDGQAPPKAPRKSLR